MTIKTLSMRGVTAAVLSASLLSAVSCSSDKKPDDKKPSATTQPAPAPTRTASADHGTVAVAVVPGEAGGVVEETFTASATVRAVDPATRKITLESADGNAGAFTAPPEMRNFDQVHVGDHVKATVVSRLVVFVDEKGDAGATHAAAVARAPKGAKPGAIVAESFELVGTVKSIDTAKRQATLEFADETKTVDVRDDVDLKRYKPGDNLVIRVTQHLTVLVETP